MKLTKSRDDVMVSGVLGGLGEYYRVDPTFLRIGFVVLMFATPFPLVPLYIIAALVMPEASKKEKDMKQMHKRTRRRSRDFNRRPRQAKDFGSYNKQEKTSSSRRDVTEDDWSDF